jgi:hypothetical protein
MSLSIRRLRSTLLLCALLSAPASAQVPALITGTVRNSTGAPVPGVNIDAFDTNGNSVAVNNDGTDVNGNFTTEVVPGFGVYNFVFYPPAPPATTHLVGERNNVVVASTPTNLGTITLGAGVLLSGRAVRSGSIPVANVGLELIDGPTGLPLITHMTKTNAFGQFNIAAPPHACEFRLNATTQAFVLGSRFFELNPTSAVALGDVALPPGAVVTGHVQRTNGTAVAGLDLDFNKVSNGRGIYVPDDNTNTLGNFSVIVALNTYDIEFCAKPTDLLATTEIANRTISGTTNLGTIVMNAGVKLFGTVTDAHGRPARIDVDVFNHATGALVPTCKDNSDGTGAYSTVVPTGTFDIVFTAIAAGNAVGDWHRNVVIGAQTQLNGMLPLHGFGGNSAGQPPLGPTISPLRGSSGKASGAGAPAAGASLPEITVSLSGAHFDVRGLGQGSSAWLLFAGTPRDLERPFSASVARFDLGRRSPRAEELGLSPGFVRVLELRPGSAPRWSAIYAFRPF